MKKRNIRESAPFIAGNDTVSGMMLDVLIALMPALAWSVYTFGVRALLIAATAVLTSVICDLVMSLIVRRRVGITDLSACVSGLVLAFTFPSYVPLYVVAASAAFGTVVIKGAFGGIGKNILNPAVCGRVFASAVWGQTFGMTAIATGVDVSATLKAGELSPVPLVNMFIGDMDGAIGEVSTLLLLAGFAYLVLRKTVTWHITVAYLAGAAGTCALLCTHFDIMRWTLGQLFSGALMLCAVFAANDTVTSPMTAVGKLVYGAGCGALAIVLRTYLPYGEGAYLAILAMNLLARPIDAAVKKIFG